MLSVSKMLDKTINSGEKKGILNGGSSFWFGKYSFHNSPNLLLKETNLPLRPLGCK